MFSIFVNEINICFLYFVSVMSLTFTFTGNDSVLKADFFPTIELEKYIPYEIVLLAFETYNFIPNVDETNNTLHLGSFTNCNSYRYIRG